MSSREEENESYAVVINQEEQHSIWPANMALPNGWTNCGMSGSKLACLSYIDDHWRDMRPKSLREKMNQQ
jgi:MbtH protein